MISRGANDFNYAMNRVARKGYKNIIKYLKSLQ